MIIDAHITLNNEVSLVDIESSFERNSIDMAIAAPSKKEFAYENRVGNIRMAQACKKLSKLRFWAVATPWSNSCKEDIREALNDGALGVAFDSSVQGFTLLGKEIQDLLEFISGFSLPVYFHTGTPVNALPLQLAHLASNFPTTNFIMGRSGRTDFRTDAIPAMKQSGNIYADTSHDYSMTGLLAMCDAVGSQRMVFSSDFPFESQDFSSRNIQQMEIPLQEKHDILSGNFLRILDGRGI